MLLSVVVVNWNSKDHLAECLAALEKQTHRGLQVIVVDNGSVDGSVDLVSQRFPQVTLIQAGENLGFAEGCNRGLAVAQGSWVAMLNNDAFAEPEWAAALVRAAESAQPDVGTLQSLMLFEGRPGIVNSTGVELRWNEPPTALRRDATGRITDVVTARGRHAAGLVVNAAGAWAAELAGLAGVELPVVPLRRQVAITEPTDALPASFPMTIWAGDGFHLRVRDRRVLLLRPTPGDPGDPWNDQVDPAWLDDIAARAPRHVPALRGVAIDRARSWAGLYEMSPDHHALLGWAPGCPNLLLVNGSSGHGVMHSPALGLLATEIATLGAARSLDVHVLRPSRFAEGEPVRGSALL